jgi:hypothetical protein
MTPTRGAVHDCPSSPDHFTGIRIKLNKPWNLQFLFIARLATEMLFSRSSIPSLPNP